MSDSVLVRPRLSPESTKTLMRNSLQFDLYLDESGEFVETSNVPQERKAQRFPSQIAG